VYVGEEFDIEVDVAVLLVEKLVLEVEEALQEALHI